ncbi:hypothetical protein Aduo_015728 [Ancylostoma duodenale]
MTTLSTICSGWLSRSYVHCLNVNYRRVDQYEEHDKDAIFYGKYRFHKRYIDVFARADGVTATSRQRLSPGGFQKGHR